MKNRLHKNIRFVAVEKNADERAAFSAPLSFAEKSPDKNELADIASGYLQQLLEQGRPEGLLNFGNDEPLPTMNFANVQRSNLTGSSVVRFKQSTQSIPVFASDIMIEVDDAGNLINARAQVMDLQGMPATPGVDAHAAKNRVEAFVGAAPGALSSTPEATLTFFSEDETPREDSPLRLAWFVAGVPFAPPSDEASRDVQHAHKPSPRGRSAHYDYLVDAHEGRILFYYTNTPCAKAAIPALPVKCQGLDALGDMREFYGTAIKGGFELTDPQRKLRTFDLQLADISKPVAKIPIPSAPVHNDGADFSKINPAAISAHVNAGRVWDFYNSILQRKSVDDEGMELVSLVHCTSSEDAEPGGDPQEWANAIWWEDRMWYGQTKDKKGELRSVATYLDIIGHELTHGVTDKTSALIYQGQSGALNESFSDIMGVIIYNWYTAGPDSSVREWTWEIGSGWAGDGKPLRDFSDPKRTGDPGHMNEFVKTREDSGGVHSNSNIHNKAAYNVLTAVGDDKKNVFTPREVAILYYLCLVRLPQRATFAKTLRVLLDVATSYYAVDEAERNRKLQAIEKAYKNVGIVLD